MVFEILTFLQGISEKKYINIYKGCPKIKLQILTKEIYKLSYNYVREMSEN